MSAVKVLCFLVIVLAIAELVEPGWLRFGRNIRTTRRSLSRVTPRSPWSWPRRPHFTTRRSWRGKRQSETVMDKLDCNFGAIDKGCGFSSSVGVWSSGSIGWYSDSYKRPLVSNVIMVPQPVCISLTYLLFGDKVSVAVWRKDLDNGTITQMGEDANKSYPPEKTMSFTEDNLNKKLAYSIVANVSGDHKSNYVALTNIVTKIGACSKGKDAPVRGLIMDRIYLSRPTKPSGYRRNMFVTTSPIRGSNRGFSFFAIGIVVVGSLILLISIISCCVWLCRRNSNQFV